MTLILREAILDDAEIIYQWRNNEATRKVSFHTEVIPYEKHLLWFKASLKNSNRLLFILLSEAQAVGSLRFDIFGEVAEVSVQIAPDQYGKGFGSEGLKKGSVVLRIKCPQVKRINANILPDNEVSQKAFAKAGFLLSHYVYQLIQE